MKQIDIHTHHLNEGDHIQILNIFAQNLSKEDPGYLFSAGLHPWHIEKVNPEECFLAIERAADLKNMVAVGECGLDRSISTDFEIQKVYFIEQIRIAEKYSKPLIIHSVRAYSDLLNLKMRTKSAVPWILHGYQGNMETTQSLMRQGFYFSAGEKFLGKESSWPILQAIPVNRLFLETDDREIPIRNIYSIAAQILKMDEKKLTGFIFNNFRRIFEIKTGT